MSCCSRKTLYILLAAAGVVGLLIWTGIVDVYAFLPFLPILICPLMCIPMLMMGRKGKDGESLSRPHRSIHRREAEHAPRLRTR